MSTAGSGPSSGDAPVPAGDAAKPAKRDGIFRWRAIGVLVLLLALLSLGYWLFVDRVVQSSVEESGTKLLGTSVEVSGLDVHTFQPGVDIGAVSIADPFDRMRNLVQAGRIHLALVPDPLLEKKLIVQRIEVRDLQFGVKRGKPAPRVPPTGLAPRVMLALQQWAAQYQKPILSFTPIDTIRALVLDPTQLVTVKAATALAGRADSLKAATEQGLRDLALQPTLDSAQAVLERLKGANPRTLGLDGTRRAVADVKRTIDAVNAAKQRIEGLARATTSGVALLGQGVQSLDSARQRDYAFARGLLRLPDLSGPQLSTALFGKVSIDRLQQALYWAELAKQYMPPGLLPREHPGPERLRRAGTTVQFPAAAARAYPSFAIESGELTFTIPSVGGTLVSYDATVSNVSSAPALMPRAATFEVRPVRAAAGALAFRASGVLDHRRAVPRDRVSASATDIPLPSFDLPALPVRVEPGRGGMQLQVALVGDSVDARWSVSSTHVAWRADSAKVAALNTAQSLIYKVLAGLSSLDLSARASGPLLSPSLSVRSNLDRAIGDRLRAMGGEALARAEARARAAVDSVVNGKTAPVRAKVAEVQSDAQRRVTEAQARLQAEKDRLDAQLKSLTGLSGLLGT